MCMDFHTGKGVNIMCMDLYTRKEVHVVCLIPGKDLYDMFGRVAACPGTKWLSFFEELETSRSLLLAVMLWSRSACVRGFHLTKRVHHVVYDLLGTAFRTRRGVYIRCMDL